MTAKVRVFNDNVHPLDEMFKGEQIHIGAKSYWLDKLTGQPKELDIFEANDYRGQYRPVPFDGSGKMVDDARFYKKLKLEPVGEASTGADTPTYKCMAGACKFVGSTAGELESHSKGVHSTAETLVLPEQDQEIGRKKK